MAKLAKVVHVHDPERNRTVMLRPGEEPEPRLAALVTAPDAWEDGEPPTTDSQPTEMDPNPQPQGEDEASSKPAAKKTAARKPARGRAAADTGDSGE